MTSIGAPQVKFVNHTSSINKLIITLFTKSRNSKLTVHDMLLQVLKLNYVSIVSMNSIAEMKVAFTQPHFELVRKSFFQEF